MFIIHCHIEFHRARIQITCLTYDYLNYTKLILDKVSSTQGTKFHTPLEIQVSLISSQNCVTCVLIQMVVRKSFLYRRSLLQWKVNFLFIKIKRVACSSNLQKVGVFSFLILRFSFISSTAQDLQLKPTNHRTVNKQMQASFQCVIITGQSTVYVWDW